MKNLVGCLLLLATLAIPEPLRGEHSAAGSVLRPSHGAPRLSVEVIADTPVPYAARAVVPGTVGVRSMVVDRARTGDEVSRYELRFRTAAVRHLLAEGEGLYPLEMRGVPIRRETALPPLPDVPARTLELHFGESWRVAGGRVTLATAVPEETESACVLQWSPVPFWQVVEVERIVRISSPPSSAPLWLFHGATGARSLEVDGPVPPPTPGTPAAKRIFQVVSREGDESVAGMVLWGSSRIPILPVGVSGQFEVSAPVGRWQLEILTLEGNEAHWAGVVEGESSEVATIELPRRAVLNGRVLSGSGEPLANALVWRAGEPSWQAMTTRDGSFGLRDLPAARDLVLCVQADSGQVFGRRVAPLSEGPNALDIIGPSPALESAEPTVTVSGRIVDESGYGLPGVEVRLERTASQRDLLQAVARPTSHRASVSTRTEPTGVFDLVGRIEPGDYRILARREGYAPTWSAPVRILSADDRLDVGDFPLEQGIRVEGQVVSADGKPASGARVTVAVGAEGAWLQLGAAVTSDGRGEFSIPGVPKGMGLEIRAEITGGSAAVERLTDQKAVDRVRLVLGPSTSLRVVVRNAASLPIAGARVSARTAAPAGRGAAPERVRVWDATTDEAGVARLSGLDCGPVILTASAKGYAKGISRLPAADCGSAERPTVVLDLPSQLRIAGRVLSDDGTPLPGVGVLIDGVGATITDELGRYSIAAPAAQVVRIRFGDDRRGWVTTELPLESDDITYDLVLP